MIKNKSEHDSMYNSMPTTYNKAFRGGLTGQTALTAINYNNPKNNLHDNIGNNVLDAQVFSNMLFIDSEHRDYIAYPNPFKFIVKFNGIEPRKENIQININDDIFTYTKYSDGDRCIIFDRIFKNIKNIVINYLFMPTYISYETKDGDYVPTTIVVNKVFCKYIVLKIAEINNERCFTNNKKLGNNSILMIYDEINGKYTSWIPIVDTIVYPDSNLKVIDKLTIEFCDERGDTFCTKLDGKQYDFYAEYRTLIDKAINNHSSITDNDIKRLQTLRNITQSISPELHITISTLEPQINTQPQFRY